ncbi:MAG: response regulator [Bdellovibrionota bacterium]
MALRVLLADESSTIKKVIQLALQDFAVEVKVVPNGLDVVEVARQIKPEIIFIDVLLTQKSGYDVSADLKANPETASIPTVLMWSGFMAIDENRFRTSKANERLEKPFETESLRRLVHKLVPRTTQSTLSSFLQFPKMPDFIQNEDAEEFSHVPLKKSQSETSENWQHRPLSNEPKEELTQFGSVPSFETPALPPRARDDFSRKNSNDSMEIPEVPLEDLRFDEFKNGDDDLPSSYEEVSFDGTSTKSKNEPALPVTQALIHEKILREEARAVLENIAWKILPDMAEKILREEIEKILRDEERKFEP